MTTRGIPDGYHAVTPFVIVAGAAKFMDFMQDAFGAEDLGRVVGNGGLIGHAEARIGDSRKRRLDGATASSASSRR